MNNHIESILTKKLGMSFDDIAGNEYAKEIINETFVLPNVMPHLFKVSQVMVTVATMKVIILGISINSVLCNAHNR